MKTQLFLLIASLFLTSCDQQHHSNEKTPQSLSAKRVAIVLPIEHRALREIVRGFETTLVAYYQKPLIFKVLNAQNDINLQRAIITQIRDDSYDMIVPIATSTTQMTAALVKQQPIVGLATEYGEHERAARHPCNIAIVNDEINKEQIIAFIHAVYPNLHKITLVHSAADKVFTEAQQIKVIASHYGITVQQIMVQNLTDLYSGTQSLAPDTEAILILKDSLIASGIITLIQAADKRKLPLITADDGTIVEGAGFALGVHEQQIGAEGGKLAAQILNGASACQLPIVSMTKPTVFINRTALIQEGQNLQQITNAAKKLDYPVEILPHTMTGGNA